MLKAAIQWALRGTKTSIFLRAFFVGVVLYLCSNKMGVSFHHELPLSSWDLNVPFLPNTVWIYNSDFFLFASAYFFCKNVEATRRFILSFYLVLVVSVASFLIYPTAYPREFYPISGSLNAPTQSLFLLLRQVDAPTNCFPSLHVSISYLSALMFIKEKRVAFSGFFLWSTLVTLSTLTTKQHYIVDLVSAMALAIAATWAVSKIKRLNPS